MIINILIGGGLTILCIISHSQATKYVLSLTKKEELTAKLSKGKYRNEFWVSTIVLIMMLASMLESFFWAIAYNLIGAIEGFEKAAYFSLVTYTTLGYGDVTLSEKWRILGSFEAATGIIIFGWTTAVVMLAIQALYFKKDIE